MLPPFVVEGQLPFIPFGGVVDTISPLFTAGLYTCQQLHNDPRYSVIKNIFFKLNLNLGSKPAKLQLKIPTWGLLAAPLIRISRVVLNTLTNNDVS